VSKLIALSANVSWNLLNFRLPVIEALRGEGYRIAALTPPDGASAQLSALGIDHVPIDMELKNMSPSRDARLLIDYRRALKRLQPAALLGFTPKPNAFGSIAAHSLGIPVINNMTGMAFMERGWIARNLPLNLLRLSFRRSRIVFFQNPDDQQTFLRLKIVRPDQARLLPGSGIDLSSFAPSPPPGLDGSIFRPILIARLLWEKGLAEFIEAARMLRERSDIRPQLLGFVDVPSPSAVPRATLDQWIAEGVIEYLGATEDVRPFIAAADCVVLPSYREGLPRVLLEGAAMGKPLISTDVPGCREVVDHGVNGFLCRDRDAASLHQALVAMADLSPQERARMGEAGRRKMEAQFDQRIVAQLYVDAVREVTAQG
jgi:glycosyltransferase involved in cell wall biosynthesis